MKVSSLLILLTYATAQVVSAFSGDDKFLKKYAMMKVYEACFGQEVVKEVRMEMKAAASKCAGISPSAPGSLSPPVRLHHHQQTQHHAGPSQQVHHKVQLPQITHSEPLHSTDLSHLSQKLQDSLPDAATLHASEPSHKTQPTLDLQKLQQAIMAGYNKQVTQQQQQQQQQQPQPQPAYVPQQTYMAAAPQHHLRPYQPQPQPQYQPVNSLFYPAYPQPQPQYIPAPQPQYQVPYQPMYQPQPAHYPTYYQGRSSRDLDVRGQLETLSNRVSGRIRNVTCVMQELGYLDANLDPDYSRMVERIARLPVSEDLKKDMAEGVDFCRQFSQCVPDDRKDKLIQEMVRPMFFFRCYKHKKLEACIMKDVRERYNNNADELTEDNLTSDNRAAKEFPEDNMATAIYEFLYGGDNIDIDTLV